MNRIWNRSVGDAPEGSVYVGRVTIFGNPFIVGVHGDRDECVDMFEEWIMRPEQEDLRDKARELLHNRDLVCWCYPNRCHTEVLARIAR